MSRLIGRRRVVSGKGEKAARGVALKMNRLLQLLRLRGVGKGGGGGLGPGVGETRAGADMAIDDEASDGRNRRWRRR